MAEEQSPLSCAQAESKRVESYESLPTLADHAGNQDRDGLDDSERSKPEKEEPQQADTPLRRSLRNRASPCRHKPHINEQTPPKAKALRSAGPRKLPTRGTWAAQYLLSNPNSKLTTINLQNLLTQERAWSALSKEQQLHLVRMLPGMSQFSSDEALPNILGDSLKSNTSFQADVRLFKEDLLAGRYEQRWLNDAKRAMEKRAKGVFDNWKEKNREEFWGQKQRVDWSALAGESREHQLPTLVAAGYFKVDDVWVMRRGQKKEKEKETVVVEKEAKITYISPTHEVSFSFPPAQHKFSAPLNGEDKIIENVTGPRQLSKAIVAEDGRLVGVRDSNSWREFRCIRKNQDMGSLWDIRELYHQRQQQTDKP